MNRGGAYKVFFAKRGSAKDRKTVLQPTAASAQSQNNAKLKIRRASSKAFNEPNWSGAIRQNANLPSWNIQSPLGM